MQKCFKEIKAHTGKQQAQCKEPWSGSPRQDLSQSSATYFLGQVA